MLKVANSIESVSDAEQRLLEFVARLILDVAHNHPRVTEAQVSLWLARVAVGAKE
jgi:hypothetical protein